MEQEQLQAQLQMQQQSQPPQLPPAPMSGVMGMDGLVPGESGHSGMPIGMAVGVPMGFGGVHAPQVVGGMPVPMAVMMPGGGGGAPGMVPSSSMAPPGMMGPGGSAAGGLAPPAVTSAQANKAAPPQFMHQQHAIQYVTTIRNRFANEPEVYR
jgi:histone deacetylase complex regulatory component SIN3